MVISDRVWNERFRRDPAAIGQRLRLDDATLEVVGVMPAGFAFPEQGVDAWTLVPAATPDAVQGGYIGNFEVVARIPPDASRAGVEQTFRKLLESDPSLHGLRTTSAMQGVVWPLRQLFAQVDLNALYLLQAAALLVLILVAANIGNLIAERTQQREREWQLRQALGASRPQLVGETMLDIGLPIVLGIAVGSALLPAGIALLQKHALLPAASPLQVGGDLPTQALVVLLGGALLALATTVTAVLSARVLAPSRPSANLKTRAAGLRISATLLVVQIVVATALLGFGALLVRSAQSLLSVDPGFQREGVAVIGIDMSGTLRDRQHPEPAQLQELQQRHGVLIDTLRALPGVDDVAAAQMLPFSGAEHRDTVMLADGSTVDARRSTVSAGYFEVLGVPLLAGRSYSEALDRSDGDALVVDINFARKLLPDLREPGQVLGMSVDVPDGSAGTRKARIVGVVGAVKHRALDEDAGQAAVYRYDAHPKPTFSWIIVRGKVDAASLLPTLRAEALRVEPDAKVLQATTLSQLLARSLDDRRAFLQLVFGFAVASLVLAACGLYAVLAFAVRQRAYEWSVRAALGARAGQLLARVVAEGALMAAIGIPIGIGVGALLATLQAERLFGVGAFDAPSWALVSLSMAGVVLAASILPARRAAAADPAQALHCA